VNIDGFDARRAVRRGATTWTRGVCPSGPCPPFYGRNQGYDINRYPLLLTDYPQDNPTVAAPDYANPVPESLNCRALYDLAGGADAVEGDRPPGQSHPLTRTGTLVFSSTLWPTATLTGGY